MSRVVPRESLSLSDALSESTHVVFYENLVMRPEPKLAGDSVEYLNCRFDEPRGTSSRSPRGPTFARERRGLRGSGAAVKNFLEEWRQSVSKVQIEAGTQILRAFELDDLYAQDALRQHAGADAFRALADSGHNRFP